MAATNQLPRIAELIERAGPLGRKQRGMPILHEEWNAIVGLLQGLLEIDRVQEETVQASLETRFALKGHEHLGQVTAAWLDPTLQAAIAGGIDGVTIRSVLSEVTQKIDALGTDVARLTTLVEEQQKAIDKFAVSDSDRSKALREFDSRFAGVENLRTLVTTVGSQVEGLKTNFTAVLELKKSLTDPTGKPIDIAKLGQDIVDLKSLSDNFKGVDGKPVRLLDVELRLKELADASGVGGSGGLDGRLASASKEIEKNLAKGVDDKTVALRTEVLAAQTAASDKAKADLAASVKAASTELDASTNARIAAAEARLGKGVSDQLTGALEATKKEITASTGSLIDQRLAAVPDQIKAAITATRPEIETGLRDSLTLKLSANVDAQVAAAEGRLNLKIAAADAKNATFRDQLQVKTATDLADAQTKIAAALQKNIDTQIAAARTGIEAGVDTRFKGANDSLASGLDTKIANGIDQRLGDLDGRVNLSVSNVLKTLPAQVSSAVKLEIASQDIAGQISRSATGVTTLLRNELALSIADQQQRSTTAVNGALTQLRGELAAAVKAGVDTAGSNAAVLVQGVRSEFNVQVASEIGKIKSDFSSEFKRLDLSINQLRTVRP